MTGNLPHAGLEATENDHRLLTRLSFDLLNSQLHSGWKIINGTVRCNVSVGSKLAGGGGSVYRWIKVFSANSSSPYSLASADHGRACGFCLAFCCSLIQSWSVLSSSGFRRLHFQRITVMWNTSFSKDAVEMLAVSLRNGLSRSCMESSFHLSQSS